MSGATLVSIHFHYILKEGRDSGYSSLLSHSTCVLYQATRCWLTSGNEEWEPPWATRTHSSYFIKLIGWKALMAHLVVYCLQVITTIGAFGVVTNSLQPQVKPWTILKINHHNGDTILQLYILYHSGWSSIHQKLKLHGKWCWKVVMRHSWLKFNPFARKTSFTTREATEEALSSRNHIWYGRLADKTILSLYTLKY